MASALVLAPFEVRHLDRLRQRLDLTYESWLETRRLYDPDDLASRLAGEGVKILVVESDFVFEEVFTKSSIEFVGICRRTTKQVDVEAATRHGVLVVNTPGRNARAVAEHTLGLMLALARGVPAAHRYIIDGRWQNPAEPYISMRGIELAGRTLGLVGIGAVGRSVAEIGVALGMSVVASDPHVEHAPQGVTLVDLDSLLAKSDFVTLHLPLRQETETLLDSERLALMRPTAYLVNTSDAGVVDQAALVELLRGRRIAGAAFDVFESHPISPQSPLLGLDNVVLTPHVGGATAETVERHSNMMADDILAFLDGERPRHLVNPEVWERRG